jgi:flagellar protein FlaJ
MRKNRRLQKEFLETLGVLAESYVTVVVAGPLFLIVMLSVMSLVGGGAGSTMMLYLIALVVLPLSNLGFTFVISSMAPEV